SSIHRQPERKEAKRRMERSVPRRSTANSAVKLRAPSAYACGLLEIENVPTLFTVDNFERVKPDQNAFQFSPKIGSPTSIDKDRQ
ncbi:MAG: hypothetical protein ACI93T_002218, partial [Porticoccaceae bacterium]